MGSMANAALRRVDTEPRQPGGEPGWRRARLAPSLAEVYRSIPIPGRGWWRKAAAFAGPGYLVAVGYMDPGNWATSIAGGSAFGYTLLSVVLISSLMAILMQALAAKLGIATGRDLAQAVRDHYSRPAVLFHWVICEIAIAACDLAEVIGSAIALQLLFHIPLALGVLLTGLDVLLVLLLQHRGFRLVEALVVSLIATMAVSFLFEIILSRPDLGAALRSFIPSPEIAGNRQMLYLAMGILGATVMPHNLYLHSSIVQTRRYEETSGGKREAIRYAVLDSTVALTGALFVNGAILVVAAAVFFRNGHHEVAGIEQAYRLLTPLLGAGGASTVFALALLASGQNSTLTGTLAGQITMEGFLNIRLRPWLRRLITRLLAITPAFVVVALWGERGTARLLILSQVILSMQLSFATFPLVKFTSEKAKMGEFVNARWLAWLGWAVAYLIAGLNVWLLVQVFRG